MPETPAMPSADPAPPTGDVGGAGVAAGQHIAGGGAGVALLNGNIEVYANKPLPHLDRGPVKAFAAQFRAEPQRGPHFALICEPHLLPRALEAAIYASVSNPALAKVAGSGPLYWAPAGAARYCFVYEDKLGQRLAGTPEQMQGLGMRADIVAKVVVRPLAAALRDLHATGMVHGTVNPANIFDGGQRTLERAMLGDCLATPPGYTQGAAFEPIERAMLDPIGKGRGRPADDLYGLGASLAVLLRHKDPLAGKTTAEIVREKIELGSYAALVGHERITGAMLELIRGLLYDDPAQRWTLADIETWLEGQHPSSRQATKKKKAARPLTFNGQSYERPTLLAMDLHGALPAAIELVETGGLDQWVTRSVEDNRLKARLDDAVDAAQDGGKGGNHPERLGSLVATALDPDGPVRYKGMALNHDGFAAALAEAFVLKKDLQPFAELINQQIFVYGLKMQDAQDPEILNALSRFETCRSFLRHTTLGYGLERCLYFLNGDVPCLSERLRKYYVRTSEDLMHAFEVLAKQPARPDVFIDRHVAAFLSIRDRKAIDIFAADLNAPESYKRALGNLRVMATIQKRAKMGNFPGIGVWVAEMIEPLYVRYHDRDLRARLRGRIDKLKGGGDIVQIAALLDDGDLVAQDFAAFRQAMQTYEDLIVEDRRIADELQHPAQFSRHVAHEMAAVVSGIFAGAVILVFAFLKFFNG